MNSQIKKSIQSNISGKEHGASMLSGHATLPKFPQLQRPGISPGPSFRGFYEDFITIHNMND